MLTSQHSASLNDVPQLLPFTLTVMAMSLLPFVCCMSCPSRVDSGDKLKFACIDKLPSRIKKGKLSQKRRVYQL